MTLEETRILIDACEKTLVVLRSRFIEISEQLRETPLEITKEVFHAGVTKIVTKTTPWLQRSRDVQAAIKTYESTLRRLRETENDMVEKEQESPFDKWRPKPRALS